MIRIITVNFHDITKANINHNSSNTQLEICKATLIWINIKFH